MRRLDCGQGAVSIVRERHGLARDLDSIGGSLDEERGGGLGLEDAAGSIRAAAQQERSDDPHRFTTSSCGGAHGQQLTVKRAVLDTVELSSCLNDAYV